MTATVPVVGGNWTATFPNTDCACGDPISANVNCVADPACATTWTGILECPCPTATVTVTVHDCNVDGERGVTFTVNVSGMGMFSTAIEYIASSGTTSFPSMASAYTTPLHFYPTGAAYTARFIVAFPGGCPSMDVPVPFLEPCEAVCPTVSGLGHVVGACEVPGKRHVEFSASLGGFGDIMYRWVWGDGIVTTPTTAALPASINRGHDYTPPGPYTARLEITSPTDCPASEITVGPLEACPADPVVFDPPIIPPGGGGGDEDDEGGESLGCLISRLGLVFLYAGAFFFGLMSSCRRLCAPPCPPVCPAPPALCGLYEDIAIGFAVAAIVGTLLWVIFCRPGLCEVLKLAWETLLVAAVLAFYLSGCCRVFMWVSLGLIALMIAAYVTWEVACDIDRCARASEWSFTLIIASSYGIAGFAWLVDCGRDWFAVITAVVTGLVASYTIATCVLFPPGRMTTPIMPPPRVVRPPTRLPRRGLGGRRSRRGRCGCK